MIDILKTKAISGVKWNASAMVTSSALQFITLAVLARLLSPSDFGLMGMVMVVINFAQAFGDMGMSNAIIQRRTVPENHLSSFFWLNVLAAILLGALTLLMRPLAVVYFQKSALSTYLSFAALIFLTTSASQTFSALLAKELQFKTLALTELSASAAYSISAIAFAFHGFGVLSLIFGQLIRSSSFSLLLFMIFRNKWLPKFHFRIRELHEYFSFGLYQMGERMLNFLNANVDYLVIGRFLGTTALGYYSLAFQLMTFPLNRINPIITKVAFPTFSRIQDDNARLRSGYCKVIGYISMVSFPLLCGLILLAPEFIELVYGSNWQPSAKTLQVLCLVGFFWSIGNPIGSLLLAKGKANFGFYWNLFAVTMTSVAVVVGVGWGIEGVAWALLGLQFPFFFIIQPIVNKLMELKLGEYFRAIQTACLSSIIMVATVLLLRVFLSAVGSPLIFAISLAGGLLAYALTFYISNKEMYFEFKSFLRKPSTIN
jgi:O-antigen/teichoic acid export membrane protein